MKKLSYLESTILRVIAETHPYSFKEVELVYRRCKSYDKTIQILEEATENGTAPEEILQRHESRIELLEKYSKWLKSKGYLDTDWITEESFAIDEFMKDTFIKG